MYDIKILRKKTQKTQVDFAKWLHIPLKTLQKWEQGCSTPPDYVLELIEYKIFCTFMVSSVSAPSEPDYKSLFEVMKKELDIEPSTSEYCIYRPERGGCAHCLKPDDIDCNFLCWVRYKEFCPD